MLNSLIEKLEQDIIETLNNSPVPIACKKLILTNIYNEVSKATSLAIEQESRESSAKEETENALSEN